VLGGYAKAGRRAGFDLNARARIAVGGRSRLPRWYAFRGGRFDAKRIT